MKKVLIIAYSFPPVGGGRVRRVLKFVKYLREFNWEPIVLTVKRPTVPIYDYSLLKELPSDIKVIRTCSIEPPQALRQQSAGAVKKSNQAHKVITGKIYNIIRRSFLVPDSRVGWLPFTVIKGIKIVKDDDVDVIMVSAEPFSSFISGVIIKFFTGRALVLDFRDEWVEFNKHFFSKKGRIVKKIEELLEFISVRNADAVVSVTPKIIETFRKRYPSIRPERFSCITNGFDPEDFQSVKGERDESFFTITYAGSLYDFRSPVYFLKAIEGLLRKNSSMIPKIRMIFLGVIEPSIQPMLANFAYRQNIEIKGNISYDATLKILKSSDLLLYIEDQVDIADRVLPAKIFDYIAIGRPVLALAGNGCVKDVIEHTGCGIVVGSADVAAIESKLKQLYQQNQAGELRCVVNEEYVSKFERRKLTGELAAVLSSVSRR